MHPEDIQNAKNLIQQSKILSAAEKSEWLGLLPDMNDKQVLELVKILKPEHHEVQLPPKPKVDIQEKEIGTSVPMYEKELPAPLSGQTVPAPADPTELQRRVEHIVKELEQKRSGKAAPLPEPAGLPKAEQRQPEAPKAKAAAPQQPAVEPLALKSPADFSKIAPAHLHGENVVQELHDVLASISTLSKKYKAFEMVNELQQSPLYKTYLTVGSALLNDPNPDRDAAYKKIIDSAKANGQEWLSKEEFEAFADFRKQLSQFL